MKRTRLFVVVGCVAGAVALAACGGSSKSSSSSSSASSSGSGSSSKSGAEVTCASLSDSFAQALLGGAIEAPKPASMPSTGCSWYLDTKDLSVQGITVLNSKPNVFDGGKRAQSNPQVQDMFAYESLSGVGDDAYYQTPKSVDENALTGGTILLVKQGSQVYNVSVRKKGSTVEQIKALEKQVAQELLKG